MSAAQQMADQAKTGVAYHARECESALRLASFAANDTLMHRFDGPGKATGLNKLAAYHSEHAFRWGAALARTLTGGQ